MVLLICWFVDNTLKGWANHNFNITCVRYFLPSLSFFICEGFAPPLFDIGLTIKWKTKYRKTWLDYWDFVIWHICMLLITVCDTLGMDLDCTPPDDSWCADVEDNPNYTIYNYHPCK